MGYTSRSEKTRNAERMSQGIVARKRYSNNHHPELRCPKSSRPTGELPALKAVATAFPAPEFLPTASTTLAFPATGLHIGFALALLGHGWITGHQNKNPANRKQLCSTTCHVSDCNPSVNAAGTCQPTSAAAAAIQHTAGCARKRPTLCSGAQRKIGPRTTCTNFRGKPCNSGINGSPSKINGGAMVISNKC